MDAAATDSSPLHIVIFPWLAFGHLLPCLELAERLADRGHRVSFVSTPRILSRLRPVAPALASLIDLVALPFPHVDGLPYGVEATCDLPPGPGTAQLHREALDCLAPAFSAFLDNNKKKVDWVLLDNFHASIAQVAGDHKVPCVLNLPYSAATAVDYGVPDPLASSIFRRFVQTYEKCKLIAVRSSFELEPESMPLLPKIFGKPVIPYGLLPPPPSPSPTGGGGGGMAEPQRDDDAASLLSWLDEQPSKGP